MMKRSLRRWFAVALLAVLPLQSAWAVAAACCTHQHDASSHHFGHHEHRHAAAEAVDAKSTQTPSTTGIGDADCPVCHLVCAQIVPTYAPSVAVSPQREWSLWFHPDPGMLVWNAIERPNWARLA